MHSCGVVWKFHSVFPPRSIPIFTFVWQLPNLTDYDSHVYIHQFGDRLGIGNYDHEGLVVDVCTATDPGYGGTIATRYTGTTADLPFTAHHWVRARESLARCIDPAA